MTGRCCVLAIVIYEHGYMIHERVSGAFKSLQTKTKPKNALLSHDKHM